MSIYVYTYDLSNEPIRPGHGFGATHLQDIGERVPQQFNQDVMGGLMEIDMLFFSRMLDYCHGYCLHWHFQETRSSLSCNYLGIGSRAKLRLKGLFLLGGKIALTAIRSRINRTLIKTNMKAENNMLEVRNPICTVLRLWWAMVKGFPQKRKKAEKHCIEGYRETWQLLSMWLVQFLLKAHLHPNYAYIPNVPMTADSFSHDV